ncbi:hypothetical protein LEP48_16845 [Isoptericola sp. NEAU-Y5]|uniref:Uncharacterized protein n=1 Tax=Isoptericola luteus TaxID=2879484 RepID=A0ABS7ZMW6_9MICO|nr:hypothetical protein [Isoptericola sp. NEAU-Y5]MCA5894999.1 hypothetical protein [Isoptericola sp. NEAU-Y5]
MSGSVSTHADRQARLADWLEEKRPDLASMYRAALKLLAEAAKPGDERTRVSHICHSMREVMKHLPEAISAVGRDERRARSNNFVRKLPSVVAKYPALDLTQNAENVPVPQEIARLLDELVSAAVSEDGRFLADIAVFLTDDGDTKHPAVREWYAAYNYFVKWAHLHGEQSDVDALPTDDDLVFRINSVEVLMDAKRAEFFDSLRAIEDLLAEANRLDEGGDNGG